MLVKNQNQREALNDYRVLIPDKFKGMYGLTS